MGFSLKKRMEMRWIKGCVRVIMSNRNKLIGCEVDILRNCDKKKGWVGVKVRR